MARRSKKSGVLSGANRDLASGAADLATKTSRSLGGSATTGSPNEPPVVDSLAPRRFAWRSHYWDYAILGLLTAGVILIHARYLQAPILDVDEAEFMALAAYVYFTGQSVFTCPNHTYTIAAHRLAIDLSQPYDLLPLRLVNMALMSAVVGLIYWWVARGTKRWIGCLMGVYLLIVSMYHNAHLVNREWPCVLALLSGAYLFTRAQDMPRTKQSWAIFAAGLITGCGLFVKEQAAYITQAVPLWLVVQVACDRRLQPWLRQGLLYAAGGLTAGAIYFTPFVWHGTLRSHLDAEVAFGTMYSYASLNPDQPATAVGWLGVWFAQFLGSRYAPVVVAIAYTTCLSITPWLIKRLRGSSFPHEATGETAPATNDRENQILLLLSCYLVTSMFSVAMGSRFFSGYFLLWMPFVAVAAGYGFHWLFYDSSTTARLVIWIPLVYALYRALEDLFQPLTLILLLLLCGWAWFGGHIQSRRNWEWAPRVALLTILFLMLILCAQGMHNRPLDNAYRSINFHPTLATRKFFTANAQPGDRLFVWGSAPEIYCVTGLEPASRNVACGGAAFTGDFFRPDGLSPEWASATIAELQARRPRFILVGPTNGDPKILSKRIYQLRGFPNLEALVQAEYRRVALLPDCDIFERHE